MDKNEKDMGFEIKKVKVFSSKIKTKHHKCLLHVFFLALLLLVFRENL
jgi:hypothetical protein